MLSEFLVHSVSRLASAGGSFLLFALVRRYLGADDSQVVYFFSFALSFIIVAARAFGPLTARLQGEDRRSSKLRRAVAVMYQSLLVQGLAGLAAGLVVLTHPIPASIKCVAVVTVVLAGFDSDLVRAALNKRSAFSMTFAIGSALALVVVAVCPRTRAVACAAFIVQWVPLGVVNGYLFFRTLGRRVRQARTAPKVRIPGLIASVALATFDGAVLNAPFIIGGRLGTSAGLDLSIATRIFASSLPLYPLVMHWSNNSTFSRLSARLRVEEPRLYGATLAASGILAGVVLTAIYALVTAAGVTGLQYVLSVGLLLSYAFYAMRIRYAYRTERPVAFVSASSVIFALFYAAFCVVSARGAGAAAVIGLEMATLAGTALVLHRYRNASRASVLHAP